MNYTESLDNVVHQATAQRMHTDTAALPTVWSGKDSNMVLWSLMEIVKAAGKQPRSFNPDDPASYGVLLASVLSLIEGRGTYLTDTGAANAYLAQNTPPLTALPASTFIQRVKILTTNVGASSYAADALPSRPILGMALTPLQGGELPAGGMATLMYLVAPTINGGNGAWILLECTGGAVQVPNPTQSQHALNLGTADQRYMPMNGSNRIGELVSWPYPSAKQNGLLCNGAAVSSAVYAALFLVAVKKLVGVTITVGAPAVISWPNHPLYVNAPVKFSSTGALPTGLVAGTTYYVISTGFGANSFQVSATINGAAINTSGVQSGVHTAIHAVHGCANDLSTFNLPNIPAGHTVVQAAGNEGVVTVGQVIAHSHSSFRTSGQGFAGGSAAQPAEFDGYGATGTTGGAANLAAGLPTRWYILFA